MAKLVILLACIATFHAVSALECYSCDNETCKKDMKQWEKSTCGKIADPNQEAVCQKLTYKDKDGKENVSRKCATVPKTGEHKCPVVPEASTDIKCPVCKTELCNSASTVQFSFVAVASVLLGFLGQKYFL